MLIGYPYKTPAQMGVENYLDAFVATKQAVYSIIYNRDVESFYNGADSRGEKIKNAIKNMVNQGRNGTNTPQKGNISFSKVGNFVEDGNYYSQTFRVSSNINMSSYLITETPNMPERRNNYRYK